jgi:hypothetical protein
MTSVHSLENIALEALSSLPRITQPIPIKAPTETSPNIQCITFASQQHNKPKEYMTTEPETRTKGLTNVGKECATLIRQSLPHFKHHPRSKRVTQAYTESQKEMMDQNPLFVCLKFGFEKKKSQQRRHYWRSMTQMIANVFESLFPKKSSDNYIGVVLKLNNNEKQPESRRLSLLVLESVVSSSEECGDVHTMVFRIRPSLCAYAGYQISSAAASQKQSEDEMDVSNDNMDETDDEFFNFVSAHLNEHEYAIKNMFMDAYSELRTQQSMFFASTDPLLGIETTLIRNS